LTLSGVNTFTGPITVSEGMLTLGNASGFGGAANNGANYSVAATGGVDLSGNALSIGSLAGGGVVTNSGAAQTLTIGSGSNSTNATFSGALAAATAGNLNVTKTGTNVQTFSGTNLYAGTTTVNGGSLIVSGSIGASATTVNGATAILGGAGTVGALSVGATGGTIAPGNLDGSNSSTIGTLSSGALNLSAGGANARLSLQLGASPGFVGLSDRVNVTGTVTLTGAHLGLSAVTGFAPVEGDLFGLVINDSTDAVSGFFDSYFNGTTTVNGTLIEGSHLSFNGATFAITYAANLDAGSVGNDVALLAIPEPGTWATLIGGVAALLGMQRARRRR
jgi:autotransporter-associated beta strand protein